MAKPDIEWATGDAWDASARESFEAQLKKTRAPKRQRALTSKASALEAGRDDEKIRAAIALHARALAEVQKGTKEERFGATFVSRMRIFARETMRTPSRFCAR